MPYMFIRNDNLWTVGVYLWDLDKKRYNFYPLHDAESKEKAAAFINFLNGGDGTFPNL